MRRRYRIVYRDGRYWPQQKSLFWWFSMLNANFSSLELAEAYIRYSLGRKKQATVKTLRA